MVKPRSKQSNAKKISNHDAAEALSKELSDKPYGSDKKGEEIERLTIALPIKLYDELETMAKRNKRAKSEHRSMSSLAREAIREYLRKHNK